MYDCEYHIQSSYIYHIQAVTWGFCLGPRILSTIQIFAWQPFFLEILQNIGIAHPLPPSPAGYSPDIYVVNGLNVLIRVPIPLAFLILVTMNIELLVDRELIVYKVKCVIILCRKCGLNSVVSRGCVGDGAGIGRGFTLTTNLDMKHKNKS